MEKPKSHESAAETIRGADCKSYGKVGYQIKEQENVQNQALCQFPITAKQITTYAKSSKDTMQNHTQNTLSVGQESRSGFPGSSVHGLSGLQSRHSVAVVLPLSGQNSLLWVMRLRSWFCSWLMPGAVLGSNSTLLKHGGFLNKGQEGVSEPCAIMEIRNLWFYWPCPPPSQELGLEDTHSRGGELQGCLKIPYVTNAK